MNYNGYNISNVTIDKSPYRTNNVTVTGYNVNTYNANNTNG